MDRNETKTQESYERRKNSTQEDKDDPARLKQVLETLPTPTASTEAHTQEVGYLEEEAHFGYIVLCKESNRQFPA